MRHPSDGTLRRLLDEPAGVADADREHIAGCARCRSGLVSAQRDAEAAATVLKAGSTADTDVDAGWRRLAGALAAEQRDTAPAPASSGRWRARLRNPVVAIAGAVAIFGGASVAAATDWLRIFQAEEVAPVTAPSADLVKIPELSEFGDLQVVTRPDIRPVSGAAAARQATGLPVPQVATLPRGVTGAPTYHVGRQASALFTFSAAKTAQTVRAVGKTPPPPPPGLDGSRFRIKAGPGLAAVWSQGRPVPALIVARAVAPAVDSSGVPFTTARDYLLSLPNLPENVKAQLRGFTGDGSTLPLFQSTDSMKASPADINGTPVTVFSTRDGTMSYVVWVDGGHVTGVAGSMGPDEVLAVARGLRWQR